MIHTFTSNELRWTKSLDSPVCSSASRASSRESWCRGDRRPGPHPGRSRRRGAYCGEGAATRCSGSRRRGRKHVSTAVPRHAPKRNGQLGYFLVVFFTSGPQASPRHHVNIVKPVNHNAMQNDRGLFGKGKISGSLVYY